MKQSIFIFLLLLSGLLGMLLYVYQHPTVQQPSRDVTRMQTFHYPTLMVKQLAHDPHAGEKIFKQYCISCHAPEPLIDVKAPRIGDKAAWATRSKRGIAALLKITVQGVGAMPARGGCFECSDDQLRQTIQYMLKK